MIPVMIRDPYVYGYIHANQNALTTRQHTRILSRNWINNCVHSRKNPLRRIRVYRLSIVRDVCLHTSPHPFFQKGKLLNNVCVMHGYW